VSVKFIQSIICLEQGSSATQWYTEHSTGVAMDDSNNINTSADNPAEWV